MLCYVLKALIFIKIGLKLSYFLQKNITKFLRRGVSSLPDFLSAGVSALDPQKAPCPHCISLATTPGNYDTNCSKYYISELNAFVFL